MSDYAAEIHMAIKDTVYAAYPGMVFANTRQLPTTRLNLRKRIPNGTIYFFTNDTFYQGALKWYEETSMVINGEIVWKCRVRPKKRFLLFKHIDHDVLVNRIGHNSVRRIRDVINRNMEDDGRPIDRFTPPTAFRSKPRTDEPDMIEEPF